MLKKGDLGVKKTKPTHQTNKKKENEKGPSTQNLEASKVFKSPYFRQDSKHYFSYY